MNGYICFYKGNQFEIHAKTTYEAQVKCAKDNKIPDSKRYLISVALAEKNGEQVTHTPDF